MTENEQKTIIEGLITARRKIVLNIVDETGHRVGYMEPLTVEHFDMPEVIQKLTDWRNNNMDNFLTHFVATPERTSMWMRDVLFKARGQMLFLVYSDGKLVGHFGFKNLSEKDVLLDNAVRGERGGHPKLFVFAGKALVQWLFDVIGVNCIHGEVMTDNISGIMMNKQIGFSEWIRYPLIKKVSNGEITWKTGKEGDDSPHSRYCYRIIIDR